jgi:uncharacterized membrane protein
MTRRWLALAVVALGLGLGVHALVVWAVPRVIMQRVVSQLMTAVGGGPVLPPPTDHLQRRVVMPSPDLLYGLCSFDLSKGPLQVRADPAGAGVRGYWSIALYADTSDNVHVLNDRQAAGTPVQLLLVGPGASEPPAMPGRRLLRMPTERGLLLLRVLVADPARDAAAAEAARRTLRCEPQAGA